MTELEIIDAELIDDIAVMPSAAEATKGPRYLVTQHIVLGPGSTRLSRARLRPSPSEPRR
ncbi:hypothetical protein [Streptomyces sp. NPDC091371]|uniref:hypothetical protein n=1 Tax=Streptomyces sp. NPDC091371 TaxID=3155303 RepID=UPI00342682A1